MRLIRDIECTSQQYVVIVDVEEAKVVYPEGLRGQILIFDEYKEIIVPPISSSSPYNGWYCCRILYMEFDFKQDIQSVGCIHSAMMMMMKRERIAVVCFCLLQLSNVTGGSVGGGGDGDFRSCVNYSSHCMNCLSAQCVLIVSSSGILQCISDNLLHIHNFIYFYTTPKQCEKLVKNLGELICILRDFCERLRIYLFVLRYNQPENRKTKRQTWLPGIIMVSLIRMFVFSIRSTALYYICSL